MNRRCWMAAVAVAAALVAAQAATAATRELPTQDHAEAVKLMSVENGVREVEGTPPKDAFANMNPDEPQLCWSKELERSDGGSWPWVRRLFLYTVWCGRSGVITYRESAVRTHHDTFCWNVDYPRLVKTAGGAGWTFVEVQTWVEVECASIPFSWPRYHDTLMMRVRYYPWGGYETVAWD
jgi:hypothetical protein